MAAKKEPSIDDALILFKDVMQRASLSNYVYVNKTILSENPKGKSVIIVPDQGLWLSILNDQELKGQMKELDINDPDYENRKSKLSIIENISIDDWTPIDIESLFKGKTLKINVSEDFEYDVPLNKTMLPFKLKKAEFKDISFRLIIKDNTIILALQKRFIFPIEDQSFSLINIFKVV